jgi:hypothetical protein
MARRQPKSTAYTPNQDWTSRGFVLENVAKGLLQAFASLAVYAIAIWLAIKYGSRFVLLGDAVDTKMPMLAHARHGSD